ncbi:MAG: hypothetical protein IPG99_01895 [Ignavibacteria bacterium]|nr:hypothetical protein [Ignavibacteria bacterium]
MSKHSSSSLERNVRKETTNDSPDEVSEQTDLEPALKIWKKFIDLLSDNLKASEINTWFSVISPKSLEGDVLTVMVPSEDYYSLIESRYNKVIASIVESLLGKDGKLKYEIMQMGLFDSKSEDKTPDKGPRILPLSSKKSLPEITSVTEVTEQDDFVTNLNQKHIFDNFIKGESNELAVAAAYAITNNPGHTYNPFFVYGGVGLGKTHIIQAIGNEVLKKFPDKKFIIQPLLISLHSLQTTLRKAE